MPVVARDLEERRRQHRHISNHPVVDIAAEGDESLFVENDWRSRHTGVKRQLKIFRRRKRVDVMANLVLFGKEIAVPTCTAVT